MAEAASDKGEADGPATNRDAIRNLLARYTYNGDRGRLAELAACFDGQGTLEYPGPEGPRTATGPAAIEGTLGSGKTTRNPHLTFIRHHITNPLIEVMGDTATARSYFTVHTDIGPDHSGTYNDRLVRTPAGWLFANRLVRIDWQSPNSLFAPMAKRNGPVVEA